MPSYDYRCNACGRAVTLFYKSYRDYDAATHTCPYCQSTDLTRVIRRVAIARGTPQYDKMSANQMLSVLEGGDSREIGQMFQQVGASVPGSDREYHEVTNRLLRGEAPNTIESDLRSRSENQIERDSKTAASSE
jgi:putative FmdB family regulatory protein